MRNLQNPPHLSGLLFVIVAMFFTSSLLAQQVDLGNLKKTFTEQPFKIGGGVSASTIFYDGNDGQGRQPFTYFLSGNVNFNFFNQVNLPFSFNLTNLGANYGYPTLPNRLSVHPMYKWVTGHIGTVTMSFSPYTLNGHMFTGAGVDLSPKVPWKINAMYGRLQRAVEYDTANTIIPASYKRMGYGTKVRYDKDDHFLGMTFFGAKDDVSSLEWQPDSLNIFPEKNVALSWEGGIKLIDNLTLTGEYGLSMMTRDVRAPKEGASFVDKTFGNRSSTHAYRAFKADVDYQFLKNTIGVGYERIDPEYRTLGAYYFNNDYENITVRFARPFLKDKANIALTWGLQRDDLNHDKEQSSKRMVSSANINYSPNDKFNASLAYSGFQTYMNIKSQFDYINGQTPYDNLDTLNFTQLSQNLSLNTINNFGSNENRRQSISNNLSFQEAADKQGDVIREGNLSRFYNLSSMYSLLFVPEAINLNAAVNVTYNLAGGKEFLIIGPTMGVRAKLFTKALTTGVSVSYNTSFNEGVRQSRVLNLRYNAAYTLLKRHSLSANTVWQKRSLVERGNTSSVTVTFAYAYSF